MKTITLTKVEHLQFYTGYDYDLECNKIEQEEIAVKIDINIDSIIYYYDYYVVTARLTSVPNTNLRLNEVIEVIEVKQTREEIKQLINEQHN